ncbi:MAG: hypothetical protein ACJAUV_000250 [Flavobacteriales bacterium]|jgi:hypothetical protein
MQLWMARNLLCRVQPVRAKRVNFCKERERLVSLNVKTFRRQAVCCEVLRTQKEIPQHDVFSC